MPDAWIVPSASGDGYLCTLSHVNLPGWNRYVPAARIAELEAELERERVRVAACGVVAMANTRDSAREARQVLPEYRSALLCDVERAVDREMAERERREAAEALLLELVAVVRGECPSLLDEDSGGDARTSVDIDAHFARYKKEPT